jgi:WhiB family redox-sensing transcriptional regulator
MMAEQSRLPLPIADHWEWQYEGACRDLPAEMFFHPDGERGPRRRNRENAAKAVCASCPVIAACRAQALALAEPYGIWGGLSEDDRALILNKEIALDGQGTKSYFVRSDNEAGTDSRTWGYLNKDEIVANVIMRIKKN